MSKPIVVIWQNGVNLFQDNTHTATVYHAPCFTFHSNAQQDSRLR